MTRTSPVLLYDGRCGLCNGAVQFVLRHDRRRTLCFAPLDGPTARSVLAAHPELRDVDSMVWVEAAGPDGSRSVFVRSNAALRVARYLGGVWTLALAGYLLPRVIRDWFYDVIARHRHRLTPNAPRCVIPPAEARERFLE